MANDEWMPGDPQPSGSVPAEPPGAFSTEMHTRRMQINACWAPGLDPMRVRLVRGSDDPSDPGGYVMVASITPSNARALAVSLCVLADAMEKKK